MREELKAEKEVARVAAKEAAAAAAAGSGGTPGKGGEGEAGSNVEEEPVQRTLKPSKSLFDMFEDADDAPEEKQLHLPRTLSKVIGQHMPHTIEVIPEGEEPDDATDVFGIDSDEETQMISRAGSGASLGSRIRREKASSAAKIESTAAAVAAAKEGKSPEKEGTAAAASAPASAPASTPAPAANPFEDLPAPHAAAASGDLTRLKVLGKLELSLLSSFDGAQRCPLFYAVAYGQEDVTAYLVDMAPDMVDSIDAHGDTPAHAAASGGSEAYDSHYDAHKDQEVADPRNAMNMTPSHLSRTPDILEVLYGFGADLSAQDSNGRSPLFVSCAMNREPCTEYIIECLDRECKIEELYEKDNRGDTPLHAAACNGSVECLLLLLQFGVDPTVSNTKGLKAIDLAARNNQGKCRDLLAEYHLHYCTSSEFDSVLFLATLEGHRQRKPSFGAGAHVQSMFSLKTNKSLRLQRWGEWIAYEDQQTDKIYWYNSSTSKGQWEKPQAVTKLQSDASPQPGGRTLHSKKSMRLKKYGDWIEYVTDSSQTFFYNEKNGEFQWHAPQGHPKYNPNAVAGSPQKAGGAGDGSSGGGGVGGEGSEWQPYKDPDSGSIFWYNTVTHVSQWECPLDDIDFQAGADNGGADSDDDDAVEVMGDDDLGI
eukprot:GSChrysophyteH2.ASY1.ANO1.949.1 assembled CDS